MDPFIEQLEDMGAEAIDTLDRLMGDKEMYYRHLKQLTEDKTIVNLRKAVDACDDQQAEFEVHTLKGIALNLGLLPLAEVCVFMLDDLRRGESKAARAQITGVEKEFQKWKDVILSNNL